MKISQALPFLLLVLITSASALEASWCDTEPSGGWCYNENFGWSYVPDYPWVYIDAKGWFYVDEATGEDNGRWLYNPVNGWFWTSDSTFAYLWSDSLQDWLLYSQLGLTVGTVQSGGTESTTALPEAAVTLYQTRGQDEPEVLATWVTDANGQFSLSTPLERSGDVYYVTADLGEGVVLAAVPGTTLPAAFTVNELTTVATAYAYAQLQPSAGVIQGTPLGLQIAAGMVANLVDIATGESSTVMLTSPNADQSNSLRSTRNLANLIAWCVAEPDTACPQLFSTLTPEGAEEPTSTLDALVRLARHPANQVDNIYIMSRNHELYRPSLVIAPDAWTLAVKVNNTGSSARPFGGTANTVFDDRGYAWINNNTVQGESISSDFIVVLRPDGHPADGTNGEPVSPIVGGGLLGTGYGIARDKLNGSIWVGNFGWGGLNPGPEGTGTGSVTQLDPNGIPISGENGYDGGTDRVQGLVVDNDGNVWTANVGNSTITVFIGGDPANSVSKPFDCKPFGLAIASDGTVWAASLGEAALPGDGTDCVSDSKVTHWQLVIDGDDVSLNLLSTTTVGKQLKGLDIDFEDHVWVGSGGDDTVYRLDPEGNVVGAYRGGGINAPWSVRIDDAGEVWVANFGPMDVLPPNQIYTHSAVTKLAGPNSPSGYPVGTPLTPITGYTLPTAGEPVLLSDGTPLGANGEQPWFTPMMRLVSVVPDRAGNLWASNNWKPNFASNVLRGDPGGDGMVIFIGIAAPTEPGRTQ